MKYEQSRYDISDEMDGEADRARNAADMAKDSLLSQTRGIDAVLEEYDLDAIFTPGSRGAGLAARAQYPARRRALRLRDPTARRRPSRGLRRPARPVRDRVHGGGLQRAAAHRTRVRLRAGHPAPRPAGALPLTYTARDLVDLFDLEPVERNIYRGQNRDIGSGRIFGGQVLAQSLVAARRTVDPRTAPLTRCTDTSSWRAIWRSRSSTSWTACATDEFRHAARDGDPARPRDLQHVRLLPQDGGRHRAPGHHAGRAAAGALESEIDIIRRQAGRVPEPLRSLLTQDRPLDRRPVAPLDPFRPKPDRPVRRAWIRTVGDLGATRSSTRPCSPTPATTGSCAPPSWPHGRTFFDRDLMGASLDHAIWFHRPFRIDDWLLYVTESTVASGARRLRGGVSSRGKGHSWPRSPRRA